MASYIFRIDELRENEDLPPAAAYGREDWMPTIPSTRVAEGATSYYWYCDGVSIQAATQPQLTNLIQYKVFSMFYRGGRGYWILRGDAGVPQSPNAPDTWQPLRFNYADGASFLTNAGVHNTVQFTRPDQLNPAGGWAHRILPNIYHGPPANTAQEGALKGDLAIFLGLIAFSARPESLVDLIPQMMVRSRFMLPPGQHGRHDKRGVVVYVYRCPSTNARSTAHELRHLEAGYYGPYYP